MLLSQERKRLMPRKKKEVIENRRESTKKSDTPDAQEKRMIALAVNLAEQQLIDGTASPSVITHYLKLGTTREKIEKEILEQQKELLLAKTDALQSSQRIEALYEEAMSAMKSYQTQND